MSEYNVKQTAISYLVDSFINTFTSYGYIGIPISEFNNFFSFENISNLLYCDTYTIGYFVDSDENLYNEVMSIIDSEINDDNCTYETYEETADEVLDNVLATLNEVIYEITIEDCKWELRYAEFPDSTRTYKEWLRV